ncbi:MAG: hybrid sensor histidine kinase/response regulator, partial [Duncaniella sp.]|nr:hybrid sensor histidine kinase/response regulator [Duncaniella sp.]
MGEEIDGVVPLTQSLNHGHELQLPPSAGDFTINFATDNYVLPDKTTYYYKLEGYNNEWITCPARVHHVTYTNLSPGHYRLLVKAVNSDGYESATPAELSITVLPPFYATPLAYILYILLGAGAIYGIVKLVRNRERRRFNERRHEDAMRKQEEINQLKFKFFTNISHELRTPLTLIVSPLEAMLKESQHDEKQTRRLSMMRNNAMRLLNLVNQLLDFRKNEVAGLQLSASEGDIIAFLRNACNSFTTMSERKNINLTFYSPDESVNMMFDEDKMGKIIMNLLSNAFKFTPAGGRVDVAVERVHGSPGAVRIKVADTGIGIKDKDKERIFERFYQVDDNGDAHPGMGSGIGLSLVSEYVKL